MDEENSVRENNGEIYGWVYREIQISFTLIDENSS